MRSKKTFPHQRSVSLRLPFLIALTEPQAATSTFSAEKIFTASQDQITLNYHCPSCWKRLQPQAHHALWRQKGRCGTESVPRPQGQTGIGTTGWTGVVVGSPGPAPQSWCLRTLGRNGRVAGRRPGQPCLPHAVAGALLWACWACKALPTHNTALELC